MMSTYIRLLIVVITLLIVGDFAVTQNVPRTFNSHDVTPVNLSESDVVHHSACLRHRRQTQPTPLTENQIKEVVDFHNDLRAREGVADMELVTWGKAIGSFAATWARHGANLSTGRRRREKAHITTNITDRICSRLVATRSI